MDKWTKRAAIAVLLAVIAVAYIGMYATWRDCTDVGGTTVRGMLGLVCIR